MIEVVYNKDEGEENSETFKIPKNIRQVGDIGNARKIYIEDYAYNYIDEYDDDGKMCVGVLLGESKKQQNERYLFIKGAMTVENAEISNGNILFTEETWNSVYNGMKKYFPEHEILGWFVIVSDFGGDILKKLKKSHMDNFAGNEKTLFVVDRTENNKYFCTYENNRLVKMGGYIIYYEKNEKMQNFLIEMRNGKKVEEENNERIKGTFRKLLQETPEDKRPSKNAFISYAANAVMVVMILFIGMYMMSSHERIDKLDSSVTGMSNEISGINSVTDSAIDSNVPVIEINGNVFPIENLSTEAVDVSVETGAATIPEEPTVNVPEVTEAVTSVPEETEAVTSSEPVNTVPKQYETYEIKKGETLITISKKFYGNTSMIDEIMELNNIEDRDYVYEGQVIKLP